MKKILLLILILAILSSCSKKESKPYTIEDGVKVVENKTTPSNPNFGYKFIEEATIPFKGGEGSEDRDFENPLFVNTDDRGNIYIAGGNSAKIYKFSLDYQFLKSFGGKGTGPGEFEGGPSSITYFDGKIITPCWRTTVSNIYDIDGNFIKKIPPKINAGFSGQLAFNDKLMMNKEARAAEKSEVAVTTSVVSVDSELSEELKTVYSKTTTTNNRAFRISDMYIRFAAGKDILYVGDLSESNFRIYGYNSDLNKVLEIRKSYRSEVEANDSAAVYMFSKTNTGGSFYRKFQTTLKDKKLYYKSINNLYTDEFDRLWVVSPTKNVDNKGGLWVDIFEDGVYLNSVQLPFYKAKGFSFVYPSIFMRMSKLFYIDSANEVIRVYSYKEG